MRCPYCEEMGERSILNQPSSYVSTLMMGQTYYDEDGRLHVHDPNQRSGEWSCSKGHRWIETVVAGCRACGTQDKVERRLRS